MRWNHISTKIFEKMMVKSKEIEKILNIF